MVRSNAVLSFEFVDEILWCDHSDRTSLAVLSNGTILFSLCHKTKFMIFLEF